MTTKHGQQVLTVTIPRNEYDRIMTNSNYYCALFDLLVQNMTYDNYHRGYSVYNIDPILRGIDYKKYLDALSRFKDYEEEDET